mmetsp:Transcript_32385/g.96694  ORF Transcript_32385/g.96694 Transcript_32385/m.96694 type:complete len:138 (+) Transcript_32385:1062-1475(+)
MLPGNVHIVAENDVQCTILGIAADHNFKFAHMHIYSFASDAGVRHLLQPGIVRRDRHRGGPDVSTNTNKPSRISDAPKSSVGEKKWSVLAKHLQKRLGTTTADLTPAFLCRPARGAAHCLHQATQPPRQPKTASGGG